MIWNRTSQHAIEIGAWLFLTLLLGNLSPTHADDTTAKDPPESKRETHLREIIELRKQIGSPLEGTLLEEANGENGDADFEAALRRVAADSEAAGPDEKPAAEFAPHPPLQATPPPFPPETSPFQESTLLPPRTWSPDSPEIADPDAMVHQLREMARSIEAVANQFEDQEDYAPADKLRELIHHMRTTARELRADRDE